MGFTTVPIRIESLLHPGPQQNVDLLVDTGALYSIVPARLLKSLGIEPVQRLEFEVADGRMIERDVGEARFFFDGRNAVSNVIFGEESDAAVLGVVTLEQMGLEVDPARKQVRPAKMILYVAS